MQGAFEKLSKGSSDGLGLLGPLGLKISKQKWGLAAQMVLDHYARPGDFSLEYLVKKLAW